MGRTIGMLLATTALLLGLGGCATEAPTDDMFVSRPAEPQVADSTEMIANSAPNKERARLDHPPELGGNHEMQLELGSVGDIVRQHFKRDQEHAAHFRDQDLEALADELDELHAWLLVAVAVTNGAHGFVEDVEPTVVVHPDDLKGLEYTDSLEGEASLPFVQKRDGQPDHLYVAVRFSWGAASGQAIPLNENSEILKDLAGSGDGALSWGRFLRAGGFNFSLGDLSVKAKAPGIYVLRDPEVGVSEGWQRRGDEQHQ